MNVLLPDFDNYKLIAIQTHLEDYRLAYLINARIGSKLKRQEEPLYIKKIEASFSVFEDQDEQVFIQHHLIQNTFFQEIESQHAVLFKEYFKKKHCLVSEEKDVDFFLRIEDASKKYVNDIIENLKNIQEIDHLKEIDTKDVKPDSHLFF